MAKFRQGDTTTINIAFDESIEGKDLKVGIYKSSNESIALESKLSDDNSMITYLGENTYSMVIPHTITRNWVGEYYVDILVKNMNDTDFVNTGEKSIKLVFNAAKIATNLISEEA